MGRWHHTVTLAALIPLLAWGQSAQHDEVEVIKAPERVPEPKADPPEAVKRILDGTNAFRKEQGRPAVTVNKELTETAAAFARYMAENDRYGHTADGSRPADRARCSGQACGPFSRQRPMPCVAWKNRDHSPSWA